MITELLPFEPASYERAASLLDDNEVVALPTETVYGLAANAFQEIAVEKIFTAKERPTFDPLIVHISERYLLNPKLILSQLVTDGILSPDILSSPESALIQSAMLKYWPGPLTFILPRGYKIPDLVTANQKTVGIRCPAHPVFQAVLSRVSFPLAAPSANRFGRISPTDARHVWNELEGRIAAILDGGPCDIGVESTILKIDFPFQLSLLRPGKISIEALEETLKTKISSGTTLGESQSRDSVSPGSMDEHYAPQKPLYLMPHSFFDAEKTSRFFSQYSAIQKIAALTMHGLAETLSIPVQQTHTLSETNDLNEIARRLFSTMRKLDEDPNVEIIVADLPDQHRSGLGAAIADRLRRASRNKPVLT